MSVARLPVAINGEFTCIRETVEGCLTALHEGRETSFNMTFFDAQIPISTFYVQARVIDNFGNISCEAQRVTQGEELLLRAQDLKARVYGWTIPSPKDLNPNYSQQWDIKKWGTRRIADELVKALKFLGGVQPDTWMTIVPPALAEAPKKVSLLWSMTGESEMLCQPGHNILKTVEGVSRVKVS